MCDMVSIERSCQLCNWSQLSGFVSHVDQCVCSLFLTWILKVSEFYFSLWCWFTVPDTEQSDLQSNSRLRYRKITQKIVLFLSNKCTFGICCHKCVKWNCSKNMFRLLLTALCKSLGPEEPNWWTQMFFHSCFRVSAAQLFWASFAVFVFVCCCFAVLMSGSQMWTLKLQV